MPSKAYWALPPAVPVVFATLEEARAAREDVERTLGISLPKSQQEIRLEQEKRDVLRRLG